MDTIYLSSMTLMKIKRVDAEAKPCIIKAITAFDS